MPAARKTTPPAEKPDPEVVGVKEVAAHIGAEPRALRGFLRRRGDAVGKGTRYTWPSLTHASVKKLAADWKTSQAVAASAASDTKSDSE